MRAFILFLALAGQFPALAELPSVVRIKGGDSCATGFSGPVADTAGSGIWTSAHFGRELCAKGRCKEAIITDGAGNDISCGDLSFIETLPELDVGVLLCDAAPKPLEFHEGELPGEASVLSFPNCGALSTTSGEVSEKSELFFSTSASGGYGSSGAPVLTQDNKVMGMVTKSSSVFWAAVSNITGGSFPLRASRLNADVRGIPYIPGVPRGISLPSEASDAILKFYRESVRGSKGLDRYLRGDEFIEIGTGLARRFKISPFSWRSSYVGETPVEALRELGSLAPIYFALNMEDRGPYLFMGRRMNLEDISSILSPLNVGDLAYKGSEEILTFAITSTYPGFQSTSVALGIAMGALGYVLAAISFISLAVILWRLRLKR